jgi:Flp pilus assembly protein TadB
MSDTSARHGPSPTASLNSVKSGQHQPQPTASVSVGEPSPQGGKQASLADPTTVLLLALFGAIVVMAFWKVLFKAAIVVGLTLVIAGILVPVMMMAQPR